MEEYTGCLGPIAPSSTSCTSSLKWVFQRVTNLITKILVLVRDIPVYPRKWRENKYTYSFRDRRRPWVQDEDSRIGIEIFLEVFRDEDSEKKRKV